MALTATTLGAAVTVSDTKITVASATSLAIGSLVRVDGEMMKVTKGYIAGSTSVPVLRGQDGTANIAHASGGGVVHGTGSDFSTPAPQTVVQYPIAGRARQMVNYGAAGAITLPTPGSDVLAVINGTNALAMTLAVPTKDMDGCMLWIASDGAGAHTVTVASGIGGAGSAYDVITINATAPVVLGPLVAMNSLWNMAVSVPLAGTMTNITAASA